MDILDRFSLLLLLLVGMFLCFVFGFGVARDGTLDNFCKNEHNAEFHQIDDNEFCLTQDNELIHIEWFDTND